MPNIHFGCHPSQSICQLFTMQDLMIITSRQLS